MKVTVIPIGALGIITKGLVQGLYQAGLRNKWRPSLIQIGQNKEKSHEDLRRLSDNPIQTTKPSVDQ